jgi:heptosyltransferase II
VRILVIQTAFIGDVVLALPVAQALRAQLPVAEIHFLVRKGNENLLANHPAVTHIYTWDKRRKYRALLETIIELRKTRFDLAVNCHRFASSGLVMASVRAKEKVGFAKNPLSLHYTRRFAHELGALGDTNPLHEVDRNLSLLHGIVSPDAVALARRPRLYPSAADEALARSLAPPTPYVVLAPASVWFTKQWPAEQWRRLLEALPIGTSAALVGSPGDAALCTHLAEGLPTVVNLAGKLSFLQTAALMRGAQRVYANDSAPLHFASAVNAPTTAIFCSTLPEFGFGPLSDERQIADVAGLPCRPCGLHGRKECPLGHFNCAWGIDAPSLV